MRFVFNLIILIIFLLSCKEDTSKFKDRSFKILIPDTTNNNRAKGDWDDLRYRSELESQLGLKDLKKGVDSLEIRLWYDFSFSNMQELYILRFKDTNCIVSYFKMYLKQLDDESGSNSWNPYKDPIIDSSFSKTFTFSKNVCEYQNLDSIWFLKSQSDLQISDNIGFTDCDSYVIAIANNRQMKYLRHVCSSSYYEKTKLKPIFDFEVFCSRITSIALHNKVVIVKQKQ